MSRIALYFLAPFLSCFFSGYLLFLALPKFINLFGQKPSNYDFWFNIESVIVAAFFIPIFIIIAIIVLNITGALFQKIAILNFAASLILLCAGALILLKILIDLIRIPVPKESDFNTASLIFLISICVGLYFYIFRSHKSL